MGMHASVVGLRPVDGKWKLMFTIYKACSEADIQPPTAVIDFFEGVDFECIDTTGVEVDLNQIRGCVHEHQGDSVDYFDVDVSKLPKDVSLVRFQCSY